MPNHVLQLDRLLRTPLAALVADATDEQWQGKERDCVNRFAMGYLVGACGRHHFLQHPTQIGIEMAVAQPSRVGVRPTAPKDLVIWRWPWSTCWDDEENAAHAPLAVIEWRVLVAGKAVVTRRTTPRGCGASPGRIRRAWVTRSPCSFELPHNTVPCGWRGSSATNGMIDGYHPEQVI